jgi:hypothetical protein
VLFSKIWQNKAKNKKQAKLERNGFSGFPQEIQGDI